MHWCLQNIIVTPTIATVQLFTLVTSHLYTTLDGAWSRRQLPESPLLIPVVVSVILAGIVSSARLYLNAHTPHEVYAGVVLGFAVCFGILYFAF